MEIWKSKLLLVVLFIEFKNKIDMYEKQLIEKSREIPFAEQFYNSELKGKDWKYIYDFIYDLKEIATRSKNDFVNIEVKEIEERSCYIKEIENMKF